MGMRPVPSHNGALMFGLMLYNRLHEIVNTALLSKRWAEEMPGSDSPCGRLWSSISTQWLWLRPLGTGAACGAVGLVCLRAVGGATGLSRDQGSDWQWWQWQQQQQQRWLLFPPVGVRGLGQPWELWEASSSIHSPRGPGPEAAAQILAWLSAGTEIAGLRQ